MPDCKVKIHEKGQAPAVIDALKPDFKQGDFDTCVIIEGGMASGRTSLSFHVVTEDGKSIIVQTSAAIIEMLHGCILGSEQRWADKRAKKK